jgi:RHS repeat-associated protein
LGLIGQQQGNEYLSYHFDLRGSTVALTNKTGQVTERFQYSPYGLRISGDASTTPFLFNGMYGVMSDSNGLYYMRARFYSPEIRRFVNQDILLGRVAEGQTLNRYAYVTGQPVSHIDPFGLASWRPQTEKGCRKLKRKIENLKKELERQRHNLRDNPQGLPTFPPCSNAKKSQSAQGHVDLYFQYKRDLKNSLDDYNRRCGGPGGTPTPIPATILVPSSNSSGDVYFWVGTGTVTFIIIGMGVIFAPEVTIPGLLIGGMVLKTAQ